MPQSGMQGSVENLCCQGAAAERVLTVCRRPAARGMCEYLTAKGIGPDRIFMEDQSKNTFQNLSFSAEFLDRENDSVGVVSNNFHIFRAEKIAKKAGYANVFGIAARGDAFLQCNNMVREFFGVLKDFFVGNM